MSQILTHSAKETISFGKKFARNLKNGAVLALVGELGAGKTQFVKGLAQGLGLRKNITSPTFVLLKNYPLPITRYPLRNLIHIDCYRLSHPEELIDLGLKELLADKSNLIVIEWADKIKTILPRGTKWLKFKVGRKPNERIIYFE